MEVSYGTAMPVGDVHMAYVVVKLIGGREVAIGPAKVGAPAPAGTSWDATSGKPVAKGERIPAPAIPKPPRFSVSARLLGVPRHLLVRGFRDHAATGRRSSRAVHRQARRCGYTAARATWSSSVPADQAGHPHSGIVVGNGNMIDAPHTGAPVRIESVWTFGTYAGAQRYVPQPG